jgi:cardiolipin synthase
MNGHTRSAPASMLASLPNIITGVRVLLVAPAVAAVLARDYQRAMLIVLIAGLSDGVDGYLARRFHWQSRLGAMLDPLADKLLFVGIFLALAARELLPLWLVLVVIGRDAVIVGGALAYRMLIGPFDAGSTILSKLNTALLVLLGLIALGAAATGIDYRDAAGSPLARVVVIVGATAFCTTLLSGMHYVAEWARLAWRAKGAGGGAERV